MRSLGLTVKAILELDEELARRLEQTQRSALRLNGADLADFHVELQSGLKLEPVRLWLRMEDVAEENEDDFLES